MNPCPVLCTLLKLSKPCDPGSNIKVFNIQMFAEVNAPWQFNGFWVTGSSTGFNINGENDKTSMKGMFLQVTDNTGIIGCSEAALA